MYPPGHIAFAYLVAKPVLSNRTGSAELFALTLGSLTPAVTNVGLQYFNVFGISHGWAHSPLLLAALLLLGALVYWTRVPYHKVPILFSLGIASHLFLDILFAFPLVYFSDRVDDIGGSWLYPWRPFIIRYEEPGFKIQPWELILEGVFLLWTLKLWGRKELWMYASGVVAATLLWIRLVPGWI